jgi:hypothetical protein
VFTIAYNRYYVAHKHSENNQEPFKQKVDKKEESVETRHSIELQAMSHTKELEMSTRASDADRDSSLLNQGVECSPEVPPADNEERDEEAASPMHAESLDSEL